MLKVQTGYLWRTTFCTLHVTGDSKSHYFSFNIMTDFCSTAVRWLHAGVYTTTPHNYSNQVIPVTKCTCFQLKLWSEKINHTINHVKATTRCSRSDTKWHTMFCCSAYYLKSKAFKAGYTPCDFHLFRTGEKNGTVFGLGSKTVWDGVRNLGWPSHRMAAAETSTNQPTEIAHQPIC